MAVNKKTFCPYPFTSIAPKTIDKDGNLTTFWPCCMMGNNRVDANALELDEDVSKLTPLEMFNHPRMVELRNNLKNGVRDTACETCWNMEDKGIQSFRQDSQLSDEYSEHIADNPKLEIIDTHVNNACNLQCRMCDPSASSQLKKDTNYFKQHDLINTVFYVSENRWSTSNRGSWKMEDNEQWQWIKNNTEKFNVLKLSGGEPFYNRHVIDFLQLAVQNGTSNDITLEFHTNATLFDDEMLDLVKKFKTNFNFSIDGHGKIYEYVRHPMTWEQLDTSVSNYIKQCQPEFLHISFIPMIYNIFNIEDFSNWCYNLDTEVIIHWAEVYPFNRGVALKHLSVDLLQETKKRVLNINIENEKLINIIDDAIVNNQENRTKALTEITLFDLSRNQNFNNYLDKELIEWLTV